MSPARARNGGSKRKGQIWRYTPSPREGTRAENDLFLSALAAALPSKVAP